MYTDSIVAVPISLTLQIPVNYWPMSCSAANVSTAQTYLWLHT